MRIGLLTSALAVLLGMHLDQAIAATGFTYRGALAERGQPAEGNFGFRLALYDAAQGGRRLGNEVTLHNVAVKAGAFEAPVDFGADVAGYDKLYLAVEVQDSHGVSTPIAGRELVQPNTLASGVCWDTAGNTALVTDFLGTTNAIPLVLKVNSVQVGEISPSTDGLLEDSANVIFGSSQNIVGAGVGGATIAGGGAPATSANAALKDFATVGGGFANIAGGYASTATGGAGGVAGGDYSVVDGGYDNVANGVKAIVAGGYSNSAGGIGSTVMGGVGNTANGDYSFAAGVGANVRGIGSTPGCTPGECGDHGTFIWADDDYTAGQFSSSGPDQFMVRAGGGVAINGKPINNQVELSIYPGAFSANYVDMFMRQGNASGGILLSAGDATASNNNASFYIDRYDGTNNVRELALAGNGDFSISANAYKPGGGSWSAPSDARLKTNVQPLAHALDRLLQLRGVRYEYSHPDAYLHPPGEHVGFIAQEVERVFPEWVGHSDDGYLTVGPKGFEALSVEALRDLRSEQDATFATLQARQEAADEKTAALEEENRELRARLARIEAHLGAADGAR
jgi:hypothetical protein